MFLHILTSEHVKRKLESLTPTAQEALQDKLSDAFQAFLDEDDFDKATLDSFCSSISAEFPFKALVHHHTDGMGLFILIDLLGEKNFVVQHNNTVH